LFFFSSVFLGALSTLQFKCLPMALTGFNYIALVGSHSRSRRRSRSALGNRCSENQSHYPALEAPRQRRGLESLDLGPTPCVLCPMSCGLSPGPQSSVLSPQSSDPSLQSPFLRWATSFVAVLALEGIVKAIIKARKKEKKIRGHKGGKWDPGEGIVWFSPPRGIGIGICLDWHPADRIDR